MGYHSGEVSLTLETARQRYFSAYAINNYARNTVQWHAKCVVTKIVFFAHLGKHRM